MTNFEARKIIEALRSGVPSRNVSKNLTATRHEFINEVSKQLDNVKHTTDSLIISAKYGEGKTHALNTIMAMAQQRNLVVTTLSISKETPIHNFSCLFSRLATHTYLPDQIQPGFSHLWENITKNSTMATKLLAVANQLPINKLYYILNAFFSTEIEEERDLLLNDLNGEFILKSDIKKIYRRLFNEDLPKINFAKTRDTIHYFTMLSHLFKCFYDGWVILFDEAELIGKFAKASRLQAYNKMGLFLLPNNFTSTYSVFAFNSSFKEEVIEGKNDLENLLTSKLSYEEQSRVEQVISLISKTTELKPLSEQEIKTIINDIINIHQKAYDWNTDTNADKIVNYCNNNSSLLRTKIRTAIEILDQIYQFGDFQDITINNLTDSDYTEDISLEDLIKIEV